MGLSAGTKLGPYEIVSAVGAGGMGEVYKARDSRLGRDVAIKVLPASFAQDGDRLRRFEQEARAVAALNHPNILTVFDVGTIGAATGSSIGGAAVGTAGSPYLVSELLEGMSLRERLAGSAMPPRKAIDYATQVARGLAAAHEKGIIHRDLKPDNIFVTSDGRVKILDFGLAKLMETSTDGDGETMRASATQAGVVMGTLGYMSPEQVRGKTADARSDIFSFGAVLYEMLSGKRAFMGDTSADVMSAILKEDPPEMNEASGAIAPALDHVVRRCLEKEPQQRFQSAGDLAFQLAELTGVGASTSAGLKVVSAGQRRKTYMAAAIAGALAAVVVAWFLGRATATLTPPEFERVTFQQGAVRAARFLPDGQSVIVAARFGDDQNILLYSGRLDATGMRPLADVPADMLLSVSNTEMAIAQNLKGLGIGYVATGTLARAPLGGGAPRAVLDNVQYADWAPDGKDMAIVRFLPETHMYRLEFPTGNVLFETSGWVSHPRFSRDGKKIAFLDHPAFGDDLGFVAVVDVASKKSERLTGQYSSTQGVAWSVNQKEIWFSASNHGPQMKLMAVSLGGRVRPLLDAPGSMEIQDVQADGRALVIQRDVRRILKVSTADGAKERDFGWLDWPYDEFFSRDGKQVVFGDQNSGEGYGVFIRDMDGTSATRLGDGDPQDISWDGKWVLTRLAKLNGDLAILPTGAGDAKLIPPSQVKHRLARWMPDGQHVVFIGNEAGHAERTFLLGLDGRETPLTPEGVLGRVPTPDGKAVLVRMQDKSLKLQPITGGDPVAVPQLQPEDLPIKYNEDGSGIYVVRLDPKDRNAAQIVKVDLKSGKRDVLHNIRIPDVPGIGGLGFISVSLDGKAYAYQFAQQKATVYMVKGMK